MLEDKFSPISEEETILSHRSVETFSQSLAHPVSSPFTFSGVCSHFHVHTNTNLQTQKIKNKYSFCFHIKGRHRDIRTSTKQELYVLQNCIVEHCFQQDRVRRGDGREHQQNLLRPCQHVSHIRRRWMKDTDLYNFGQCSNNFAQARKRS